MNAKIQSSMAAMQKKLLGCVGTMSYYYAKLCVKANPAALLDIEIKEGDVTYHVEDFAVVIPHTEKGDDDKIDLIPRDSERQLQRLSEAVTEYYPEFQQEILEAERDREAEELKKKALEEQGVEIDESAEERELRYLRLTMPVVDDDRKKVLDDGIKTVHDAVQTKMDSVYAYHSAEVTAYSIRETKEEAEAIKKSMEDIKAQYEDIREQLTDQKKKEVEDANKRYHEQQALEGGDTADSSTIGQSVKL